MPATPTNSFVLDALKKCALDNAEEQQQELITNASESDKLEVKAAFNRASQFVGNPDGTFPCPHCFIKGHYNTLSSYGINHIGMSEFRCEVCNTPFYVGS